MHARDHKGNDSSSQEAAVQDANNVIFQYIGALLLMLHHVLMFASSLLPHQVRPAIYFHDKGPAAIFCSLAPD